jgi:Domain of unknown function (DUF4422)/Glycosyltransferase 61/Methyltransferase domain
MQETRNSGPSPAGRRFAIDRSVAGFQPTSDVTELGRSGRNQVYSFCKSARAGEQLPLFFADRLSQDIVLEHEEYPDPPEINLYATPDVMVGSGGLLHKEDRIWLPPDCYPGYLGEMCEQAGGVLGDVWASALTTAIPTVVRHDLICASPWHPNLIYGHFLMEILPKLYLLRASRDIGVQFKVAMWRGTPSWAKAFIDLYFNEDDLIWYDKHSEILLPNSVLTSSMMHHSHNFHPLMNVALEDVCLRAGIGTTAATAKPKGDTAALIYLSRTRIAGGWHKLTNESDVEETFRNAGFTVVHPQELALAEQLAIYRRADCLAGQYSSALHNSLFARRGIKVLSLNRINWYQSRIARLRGQRLGFVPPADGAMRDWRRRGGTVAEYSIDCAELRSYIADFIGEQHAVRPRCARGKELIRGSPADVEVMLQKALAASRWPALDTTTNPDDNVSNMDSAMITVSPKNYKEVVQGIRIYVVNHLTERIPNQIDGLTQIYVGQAAASAPPGALTDHLEYGQRPLNERWSELSAIYRIWQEGPKSDIVGFLHYRRYLNFGETEYMDAINRIEHFDLVHIGPALFDERIISAIDRRHSIIGKSQKLHESVFRQYGDAHNASDYLKVFKLVCSRFPRVAEHMASQFETSNLYAHNLFIMIWEGFDELCNFWFEILEEFTKLVDWPREDAYQSRDVAFLSERLFDAWIRFKQCDGQIFRELPVIFIEESPPASVSTAIGMKSAGDDANEISAQVSEDDLRGPPRRRSPVEEIARFQKKVSDLIGDNKPLKIYCGCGEVPRIGFLNLDIKEWAPDFMSINPDEYFIFPFADMAWGIADNCVDYIFDEDFIEHITQLQQIQFLAESLRVLKPGGYHRVSTPSIIASMKRFSNFRDGYSGVYTGELQWDHISLFSHFSLKEIAELIGYREVIFTTKNHSVSPFAQDDTRPGHDRDEVVGNIFADLQK